MEKQKIGQGVLGANVRRIADDLYRAIMPQTQGASHQTQGDLGTLSPQQTNQKLGNLDAVDRGIDKLVGKVASAIGNVMGKEAEPNNARTEPKLESTAEAQESVQAPAVQHHAQMETAMEPNQEVQETQQQSVDTSALDAMVEQMHGASVEQEQSQALTR